MATEQHPTTSESHHTEADIPATVLADITATSADSLANPSMETGAIQALVQDALHTIRVYLGMDVAFVSEFVDNLRFFRYVDSGAAPTPVAVGNSDLLVNSYCHYIVDGRLPAFMPDTAQVPFASTLESTAALPVGSHISVPIRFSDGQVYGTFCCFSAAPDPSLVDRDLALVELFAKFTAKQLERQVALTRSHAEMTARIQAVLASQNVTIVYQPIYHIRSEQIVGFEALTRFADLPMRPPHVWFAEAARVGLAEALEQMVLTNALKGLVQLPSDTYLSLNVSPAMVLSGAMNGLLAHAPLDRIVLELTEHESITDYAQLAHVLTPLRERGLRLAVDDAGAGYASFRHILRLDADMIKLDISLTHDIDTDRTRRALAAALIRFAEETGSRIIAEGVETESELSTLRSLAINHVQGYLMSRPLLLADAVAYAQQDARRSKRA